MEDEKGKARGVAGIEMGWGGGQAVNANPKWPRLTPKQRGRFRNGVVGTQDTGQQALGPPGLSIMPLRKPLASTVTVSHILTDLFLA